MAKTDTIVWIHHGQIASESMSSSIKSSSAAILPQAPASPRSQPKESHVIPEIHWGVWDEVQAWQSPATPRPTPALIQRFEQCGFTTTAFFLSVLSSIFPLPNTAPSEEQHRLFTGTARDSMQLLPKPSLISKDQVVLRRSLRSDLELARGLAVIANDPYWQEHCRGGK